MGTDLEGVVVSWNHGGEKLFGYTEEEALGKHLIFLHPQDRHSECLDNLRRIGQREYLPRYESRRVRKDGSEFDVSVIVSPITDSQGNLLGMSSICRDITERKRAEGVLQVAKQTADMASRAKSEFLANMSHELRTPLNGVIGLTNAVLDSELTEEQREHITLVKDSANSLLTILTDILDRARIQSGKYVLQPKEFLLRDLMDRTMREFEAAAHDKNLQFTWHIQPDVPPVFLGDSSCLRQILSNVVQNAIKFTAAGEVAVTVEVPSQDPGMLSFTVRDTGIGVPVEQQRIIFEPFSQVDNSLRRKFGGTGLGLAICGQLIDIMGGRIWVDSDGHTGSTFRFRARLEPVHADPEKTATEPGVQPTPSERRREIRRAADGSALMRILRPFSLLPLEVQLLNLSKGGLKVRTSQSLDFGAIVQINRMNTVTIAEVRYCIPDGNHFHAGLKIISDIHD
jgi:PAS domain S-box-containing protein